MKILYIIALISFAALAWAAVAITQHVRRKADDARSDEGPDAEMAKAINNRIDDILRPSGVRPAYQPLQNLGAVPPPSRKMEEEDEFEGDPEPQAAPNVAHDPQHTADEDALAPEDDDFYSAFKAKPDSAPPPDDEYREWTPRH